MIKQFHRYGNWGICYIYGAWFALGGLAAAGKTYYNCLAIRKGVDFLLKSQCDNGGNNAYFTELLGKLKEAMYEKYQAHSKHLINDSSSHFYRDYFSILRGMLPPFTSLSRCLSLSGPMSNFRKIHF